MRAGVICDDWKLPVFRKRLTEAGFTYEDGGAPIPNCTNLIVVTDDMVGLAAVVAECQAECAAQKRNRK